VPDIFLSYNREDQARAKVFAEVFEKQGFSVWWDVGLRTGEAYDQVTEKALREARAVVVLWSKRSVESRWVRAEATLADRNKTLLPCMIESCERPIMFELTQTADLSHWQGDPLDRAWLAFVNDVHRFVRGAELVGEAPKSLHPGGKVSELVLAVLPFDNLSDDREMLFFSDGVSEEILGRLSRIADLKVIGRTSSFQFRGVDKSRAASALAATHVLDGSIRRAGGRIRIAAHLADARRHINIWSDRFDRDLEDVFAVQDEIAEAIASALMTKFLATQARPIEPAAYDLFLRSRTLSKNRTDDWINHYDRPSLERVVALAPNFAEGWSALALALCEEMRTSSGESVRLLSARAREAAMRSLAIDPNSSAAHIALHFLEPLCGRYDVRVQHLQRAIKSAPSDPIGLYETSRCMMQLGRIREAHSYAAAAKAVDPYYPRAASWYAYSLLTIGLPDQAFRAFETAHKQWPKSETIGVVPIYYAACESNWALVDELTTRLEPSTFENPFALTILDNVRLLRERTSAGIERALEIGRRQLRETGTLSFAYLAYACQLDLVDEIFDLIDQATFEHLFRTGGQFLPGDFGLHCLFDAYNVALRRDVRFPRLCARLGLVEYWLTSDVWPDCVQDIAPFYDFKVEGRKALQSISAPG
jgi:TolB-like protein